MEKKENLNNENNHCIDIENASSNEKKILENKDNYIKINESEEVEDITNMILDFSKNLKLGEMIHSSDFNLEETMNSVELNHKKMDFHANYREAQTFKKLIREGKIKKMEELTNEEVLLLIDSIFIREVMWLYGAPVYQTIFSLVYFSDNTINEVNTDIDKCLFRIYFDSTLQLLYLTYSAITECSCLRDEDVSLIPIHNLKALKREKVQDELKKAEEGLRSQIKLVEKESEERKILALLVNRIRARRILLKIIEDSFNLSNKNRYENLISQTNTLKDLLNEMKKEVNLQLVTQNIKKSDVYFCDKLVKISPLITNLKQFNLLTLNEAIISYDKFLGNLVSISSIYDLKEFYQILKSVEILNSQVPSFLIRCIVELNLFPKNSNLLFGKIDYTNVLHEMLKEAKIDFVDENSEIITNMLGIYREIIIKNLKNRARQVRESGQIIDGLAMLVFAGNQTEKEEKKKRSKKNQKTALTNLLLKQTLHEMIQYIWVSFELDLYSAFELDYIFYSTEIILNMLEMNNRIVASKFADMILKEQDFVKNPLRKIFSSTQKQILDEIHILSALKYGVKGMALLTRYLKVYKHLKNPQTPELEEVRINNRFPHFKNCKYFLDISYQTFIKDIHFDVEKEVKMFHFIFF